MRIFKKARILCFLIIVGVINSVLSFLIEPAQGASATMWKQYYKETEIDTIFIGSSLCSAAFDPLIFDEQLGVKAFNMGTPMQALEQNITALETAFEEHDIKTVVVGMGFFVLQEDTYEDAELTFEKALAREKGGIKGGLHGLEYVFSNAAYDNEKSVNYWFPWIYNKETYSWEVMMQNVKSKLMQRGKGAIATKWKKGYSPYEGMVDYNNVAAKNSYYTYNQELKEELLSKLEKILVMCKENDVDVMVINTPHPDFDIISCYEVYERNDNIVRELCKKNSVDYYNFSLAKNEVFEDKEEYYYDFEHLNYEGSQAFCYELCDFMIKREKGKDMNQYFYAVEEYFALNGLGL